MKRYAIVRVDKYGNYLNSCPAGFEEINNDFVCSYKKGSILNQYVPNCKKCRYGDTKEQLVKKIMTAFKIAINENKKGNMPEGNKNRRVAEIIVEFLGVK